MWGAVHMSGPFGREAKNNKKKTMRNNVIWLPLMEERTLIIREHN